MMYRNRGAHAFGRNLYGMAESLTDSGEGLKFARDPLLDLPCCRAKSLDYWRNLQNPDLRRKLRCRIRCGREMEDSPILRSALSAIRQVPKLLYAVRFGIWVSQT